MNKKVAVKRYLAFDTLYISEDFAKKVIGDWEHKEHIKTVYVGLDENDMYYDVIEAPYAWVYANEADCIAEVKEYNEN